MRLTKEERAARKASFRGMSLAGKAEYIYTYYRLPIILGSIALYLVCSAVYRQAAKKEAVLYAALVNVSVGDELGSQLNEGFISARGADPRKAEVYLYRGTYLSDDPSAENHEYGYASRLKLMAAIETRQLDIVLMNKEAYDICSQEGYLLEFPGLLPDPLYRLLEPDLTANTVVLEDLSVEYALRGSNRCHAVTEEATNGLDVSAFPLFQEAGFQDPVYLGIIANSPRLPAVKQYIAYLAAPGNT